ncbi:MAG: hypothetical protein ACRBB0_12575 [Pelagimonas sp.]|uniref:hypothetical protein n=1 Tax=Pelagimonas sp. TaxID=2073170 RepID=UPI003D6B7D8D
MSKPYLGLTVLMIFIVVVHVFLGGPQYAAAFAEQLSTPDLRAMSGVLWHAVTVALIGFAISYMWLAFHHNPALCVAVSVLQIGWAGLFLYYGITQLGELGTQPQWVLFLGFPMAAYWAERQRRNMVGSGPSHIRAVANRQGEAR